MLFTNRSKLLQLPNLSIEMHDEGLRRQLSLTTADLRFADYLVKSVCDERFTGADKELYEDTGIQGAWTNLFLSSSIYIIIVNLIKSWTIDCMCYRTC